MTLGFIRSTMPSPCRGLIPCLQKYIWMTSKMNWADLDNAFGRLRQDIGTTLKMYADDLKNILGCH
eukprot:914921-Karenia_brevis.AAC.1